jgi:nucleotide-binding universal stress UspA family protein
MYKKILVPLDGSKLCANALDPAEDMAKQHNAEMILIHVVPHATIYTEKEGSFCDFCEPDKNQQAVAEQFLSNSAEALKAKGIKASWVTRMGERPAHEIVEFGRENGVDLIVMTTHGRSGFAHYWLGSTAEKVLRRGSEFASVFLLRCKG